MQDLVAILVAVATAAWLARTIFRRATQGGCGSTCRTQTVTGADGFVSLDMLKGTGQKESGRPEGRPD
ncbi:MAG: hypothetical protein ACKOCN_01615 [Planctomycetaceae bacterium]